jgi:hypothetical protein
MPCTDNLTLMTGSSWNIWLSEAELALAGSRPSLHAQVYCILQIGYFKAKQAFSASHLGRRG